MTTLEIVTTIINSGAIQIRDVDAGEEPFLYSSGNRGPGYIMIKDLCGQPDIMKYLTKELARKVNNKISTNVDIVNGNVSGGVIPAWELCRNLSKIQNRQIPYVYLREARKQGGHNELITGDSSNPLITKSMKVLVVEELVNYATTSINAVEIFRNSGYISNYCACILSYDHPDAMANLAKHNIQLISLITLQEILNIAEQNNLIAKHKIDSYRNFLQDSIKWQLDRNLAIPEEQALEAIKRNYKLTKLNQREALDNGIPESKVRTGFIYWAKLQKSKPMIYVALDCDSNTEILEKAQDLAQVSGRFGFKINLDGLVSLDSHDMTSSKLIQKLKTLNKPIFLDFKLGNGDRTLCNITQQCIGLGIDIINIYPHVGRDLLTKLVNMTRGTNTKIFVLTILTHFDDNYSMEFYGKSLYQIVRQFANLANEVGADGIILPATCLDCVKDLDILKLCPGIRSNIQDTSNKQKQISTIQDALTLGANYCVIGSPIMESSNPKQALQEFLEKIEK